jgi:L-alanine-DL-glutamate epimerase-like enolase superfamily enzyme
LLTSATLHLNAFLKRSLFVEFNVTRSPLVRALMRSPLQLEEGCVRVPQEPGLGVEVDEDAVRRYRIL